MFITSVVVKVIVLERRCFWLSNLDLFPSYHITVASPHFVKEFRCFSTLNDFSLGLGTLNSLKANKKYATLIVVTLILSTKMTEISLLSIMSDFIEMCKLSI
jgi:hypothetical protein